MKSTIIIRPKVGKGKTKCSNLKVIDFTAGLGKQNPSYKPNTLIANIILFVMIGLPIILILKGILL